MAFDDRDNTDNAPRIAQFRDEAPLVEVMLAFRQVDIHPNSYFLCANPPQATFL
jgi:hypothetical protein